MRRRGVPEDREDVDSGVEGFKGCQRPETEVGFVAQGIGIRGVRSWGEKKHRSNGISFKRVPFGAI